MSSDKRSFFFRSDAVQSMKGSCGTQKGYANWIVVRVDAGSRPNFVYVIYHEHPTVRGGAPVIEATGSGVTWEDCINDVKRWFGVTEVTNG